MTYSLDDFLTFAPVYHKELQRFAVFFAEQMEQGEDPVAVVEDFATNVEGLYGIPAHRTVHFLGLEPQGMEALKDAFHSRHFSSPELEHHTMKEEARARKHFFESQGFTYHNNVLLPQTFTERLRLLQEYQEVRIAPTFLPMGEPMYVPDYVSLWVKKKKVDGR